MTELLFHPPAWVLSPRGEQLHVVDLEHGEAFEVQGELKAQLERPQALDARSALLAFAHFDPIVARFAADYVAGRTVPLTRAALLAGGGFGQLFVELTAQCNERCAHCYAESAPERHEALSWRVIEEILADARDLGFTSVQLTGGDPLLSPYCARAAERVREQGFEHLEVYTNGLALTDAVYAPLRAAKAGFAFSFYSADPAVHDAVTRTPGSQARTLAAIRRVVEDGLRVRVSIIVSSVNDHTVEGTVSLLRSAGVPAERIAVDQVREVGRGRYQESLSAVLAERTERPTHSGRKLSSFVGKASVAGDGTVFPCIFSRKLPLGNVNERRLAELLTDPAPVDADAITSLARADELLSEMTCWECRVRNALLAPPTALLNLRVKGRRA